MSQTSLAGAPEFPFLVMWAWWQSREHGLKRAAAVCLGSCLVLVPVGARNLAIRLTASVRLEPGCASVSTYVAPIVIVGNFAMGGWGFYQTWKATVHSEDERGRKRPATHSN